VPEAVNFSAGNLAKLIYKKTRRDQFLRKK
jgi:hypothetical protein